MPPAGCTIVARNYLSHARILARSYLRHHPGANFYLHVVDELPAGVAPGHGIRLVRPRDLELPYFYELCLKYDVTELSTAVKPTLLQVLMMRFGERQVVYLDPDILVTRRMRELMDTLDQSDVVLVPHILDPIPLDGRRPSEQDLLIAGAYNLGFIALRDTPETQRFLKWWAGRLRDHCHVDTHRGLMTDQKWIDLVPSLFPSTVVLRDETYDVAYWNIHSRELSVAPDGSGYLINGKPLTFFHFSGFTPAKPDVFSKHQNRTTIEPGSALARLLDEYVRLQFRNGYKTCSKWQYGYSKFSNGAGVHKLLKELYLDLDRRKRLAYGNPFHVNGPTSFLRWATTLDERGGLSPFAKKVYQSRRDLSDSFPDVKRRDREKFLKWARKSGAEEMRYDPELIPRVRVPKETAERPAKKRGVSEKLGINVVGYLRNESGLGAAARGYVSAIRAAKVPLALKDVSTISVNRSTDRSLVRAETKGHPFGVNLVCVNADEHFRLMSHLPRGFFKDRYNIGVWAWELPSFPEKWHDRFPFYDEIWVGSSFIANTLASISPIPVVRIPPVLAADLSGSRAAGRRRLGAREDQVVFAFVFDFHSYAERKNPLGAIAAFKRAFGRSDRAMLVVKCVNAKTDEKTFSRMQAAAKGHSIQIHEGYWPAEHVRDLMHACDAYMSLHRSEGTGLTISDAMAIGKPVIATGWSGNTDFMTAANSFPVRYELVQLRKDVGPYKTGETWADPSVEHAAALMRHVFENPDEARAMGRAAKRDIHAQFSAKAVGKLIRDRFDVIARRDEFRSKHEESHAQREPAKLRNYRNTVGTVQQTVCEVVPEGETVAVVSKGDATLLELKGRRRGWHFPRDKDGQYAGYHPADSDSAIAHLQSLRRQGAKYFVLPQTSFWWLKFYPGLKKHLRESAERVVSNSECMIYRLRAPAAVPTGR
jgi:glycosyltransferase involved in cell wall biosynthesis